MFISFILLWVLNTFINGAKSSLSQGCRCYLFQSGAERKEGRFQSPKFPNKYPPNIRCLLYVFVADRDEIVRLQFFNFNMKKKINNRCIDKVSLYLNLARAELHIKDQPQAQLCGSMTSLPQNNFYSANRVIIMELQTGPRDPFAEKFYNGFQGNFTFEKKKNYERSGKLTEGTVCNYVFRSTLFHKKGKFFSPRYPQNYPNNTVCSYKFYAAPHERVVLEFNNILLEDYKKTYQCDPKHPGDNIVVYEDLSTAGNVLRRFNSRCGPKNAEQAVSDGTKLLVVFRSDKNGIQAKGFQATYKFVESQKVIPSKPIQLGRPYEPKAEVGGGSLVGTLPPLVTKMRVEQNYSSLLKKTGSFTSPNYPLQYPRSITVVYKFRGLPGERVRLFFDSVQLDSGSSTRCGLDYRGDFIEVYDGMSEDHLRIHRLCGTTHRQEIWSSGSHLTVKFSSDDVKNNKSKGFLCKYRFSPVHVNSGTSANGGIRKVVNCTKYIKSSPHNKDGILTSSGYPDGYQPSLLCQWTFSGMPNERVRVEFLDFDVGSQITGKYTAKSCIGGDIVTISKRSGTFPASEILEEQYCGKQRTPFSVMSTDQPYLKVEFTGGKGSNVNRGIELRYSFITDYAVKAPNGRLIRPDCRFIFDGKEHRRGNFTSPNYPDNYPESVTCYYEFKGQRGDRIRIDFAYFDVETTSRKCRSNVDFVTAMTCSQKSMSRGRLCGQPDRYKAFKVEWNRNCGILVFRSNERFVRRGFLGHYAFLNDREGTFRRSVGGNGCVTRTWMISTYLYTIVIACYLVNQH